MMNIRFESIKLPRVSATKFIIDRETHEIIETDGLFRKVVSAAKTGKSPRTLESLFVREQADQISRAADGKLEDGIAAYSGLLRLRGGKNQAGVIAFLPHYMIDGTQRLMCVLTVFAEEDEGAAKKAASGMWTAGDLKQMIDDDEFELGIEPVCALDSGRVVGGEILAYRERAGERLTPAQLFSQFEEEEICGEFDFYILTKSLQTMACAERRQGGGVFFAFALSDQTFRSRGFVERIAGLAEAFEIDKKQILFRVGESLLLSGPADVLEQAAELRADGFRLAVVTGGDARLTPLLEGRAADALVIGPDCTDPGLDHDHLQNLSALAAKSGIRMICKGIETAGQKEQAGQCGCAMGQGGALTEQMPLAEFLNRYW